MRCQLLQKDGKLQLANKINSCVKKEYLPRLTLELGQTKTYPRRWGADTTRGLSRRLQRRAIQYLFHFHEFHLFSSRRTFFVLYFYLNVCVFCMFPGSVFLTQRGVRRPHGRRMSVGTLLGAEWRNDCLAQTVAGLCSIFTLSFLNVK